MLSVARRIPLTNQVLLFGESGMLSANVLMNMNMRRATGINAFFLFMAWVPSRRTSGPELMQIAPVSHEWIPVVLHFKEELFRLSPLLSLAE